MSDTFGTITAATLRAHVEWLAGHGPRHADNPTGVLATLDYVTSCLSGYGLTVEVERFGDGLADVNLLSTLPGTGDGAVLEIGAHWDTTPDGPGADDNASGLAGLLELARVFASAGPQARTLRFCVFGGEEDPSIGYLGSRAHVARLDADTTDVEGAIILEMIGYRDPRAGSQRLPDDVVPDGAIPDGPLAGDFIAAVGNEPARGYLTALQAAAASLDPPLPMLPVVPPTAETGNGTRSDHLPYWLSGRPAVMVSDTADFRNPHYHQPSDTVDTLDFAFAEAVTSAVARAIHTLAGTPR